MKKETQMDDYNLQEDVSETSPNLRNAKSELIEFLKNRQVIAGLISRERIFQDGSNAQFQFRLGDNWESFLEQLNFGYDSGYGSQELFGIVWFEDGSWAERDEYDGSEWWQRYSCPQIPENLLR
jgi:hypothetical protein